MALSRAENSLFKLIFFEGVIMQDLRLASALVLSAAERSDVSTMAF
jgi:hypothetical protein